MNESQWMSSDDPREMVDHLWNTRQDADLYRRLRLFICAILEDRGDKLCLLTIDAIRNGRLDTGGSATPYDPVQNHTSLTRLLTVSDSDLRLAAVDAIGRSARFAHFRRKGDPYRKWTPRDQTVILRDIFGNPFREKTVKWSDGRLYEVAYEKIEESRFSLTRRVWRPAGWLTADVRMVAGGIYSEGCFSDIRVLADALEEAGCPSDVDCPRCGGGRVVAASGDTSRMFNTCTSCGTTGRRPNPILAHLREPCPYCKDAKGDTSDLGVPAFHQDAIKARIATMCPCGGTSLALHVHGCWVIDVILGKGA
jgi:hypothetical protein